MHADELRRDVNEKEQNEDANEMKYDCDDLKNLVPFLLPFFSYDILVVSPEISVGPLSPDASGPPSLLRRFFSFRSFFSFLSRFRFSPFPSSPTPAAAAAAASASPPEAAAFAAAAAAAAASAARAASTRRRSANAAGIAPLSPSGNA